MKTCKVLVFLPSLALLAILPGRDLPSAEWRVEWESTLAAARKEGKVVVGIPPSAELRKHLETTFKSRFGLDMELFPAAGPQIANRIVSESKAGVRYFDAFIFGSCTGVPLISSGVFDPIEP